MYRLMNVFSRILLKSEIKNGQCKILRMLQLFRNIPKYHSLNISLKNTDRIKDAVIKYSLVTEAYPSCRAV